MLHEDVVRWICNAWGEYWVNNEAIGAHIRVGIGAKRGTMGGQRNNSASFLHQDSHSLEVIRRVRLKLFPGLWKVFKSL